MHAIVGGERGSGAFLQVQRHALSRERRGRLLVVEHAILLIVAVDSGQVNAVCGELTEHLSLRRIEIGTAPAVALREHDKAVIGQPLPLIKELEINKILLRLFCIERADDGGFRVARKQLLLVLVAVELQHE